MFVAIVTAPGWPASMMISASRSWFFAFRTSCGMPWRVMSCESVLGHLDGDRADEHRLADLVALLDVAHDRVVLGLLVLVDVVVLVVAHHRPFVRDLDDVEVVDLLELLLLGLRGTGHAGELLVEAEVVLERDRGERDVLLLDRHALLRLDRLVQAVRPAAPLHDPAGELVDDLHLAVHDDVLVVAVVERLGLERLDQVVHELRAVRVVEVLDPERAPRPCRSPPGAGDTFLNFSS